MKNKDSKELHRLHRQDLLELLLAQSKDVERQQEEIETLRAQLTEVQATCERLKGKLDVKDAQIEHLKERLDQKDATIARLQAGGLLPVTSGESGSAKAIRISQIFDVARDAAGEYLQKVLGDIEVEGEPESSTPEESQ